MDVLTSARGGLSLLPSVVSFPQRLSRHSCIVVGIWDVMSNAECCETMRDMLAMGETNMGSVCEELLDMCLEKGSKDNMSAVVLAFEGAVIGAGEGVGPRRRYHLLVPLFTSLSVCCRQWLSEIATRCSIPLYVSQVLVLARRRREELRRAAQSVE